MSLVTRSVRSEREAGRQDASRPKVLLITEGTYPLVVGGVSSWCHRLLTEVREIDWIVLPLVAGSRVPDPAYDPPAHVTVRPPVELWSLDHLRAVPAPLGSALHAWLDDLPSALLRGVVAWEADVDALVDTLVGCRRHPGLVRRAFRSPGGWHRFREELRRIVADDPAELERGLDHLDAATLYQAMYWVARTAAASTPEADVIHVTAAGWSAIPAAVHQALYGTPVLLTEHGLYLRESYLAAILDDTPSGERYIRTRLAHGLVRLSYATSDHLAPVSEFNAHWEVGNGIPTQRIQVIPNGVPVGVPTPLPGTATVVSVGRLDPLKDVLTMLRVAAEVLRRRPDARFHHHGPVSPGQAAYAAACRQLHAELELGDRFRFLGPTRAPDAAVQAADVALLTSISEGMPLAVLEAMAQARPVVATSVGGVPEIVEGCGLLAPPGHVERLAGAVCTLLDRPALAQALGLRGRARVERRFRGDRQLDTYRRLLTDLATQHAPGAVS